jgi:glycosyltransferase involved in cell wall biosynthesis
MQKIIVVHIITKMELGGAQQNTLFTVSNLDPCKYETFLLAGTEGELIEEVKKNRNFFIIKDMVREIRPFKDIKAFFQIVKILKKIKSQFSESSPVIVHTHSSKAGMLGRWAAKAAGVKVIIHSIHGFPFNDFQPFLKKYIYIILEKITAKITSHFIAVSSSNIDEGIRYKIFNRDRTTLIRSGIDILKFKNPETGKEEMKNNLEIPLETPVVLMVSCLKPQKAPLDFVKACFIIKEKINNVSFLLAGDGVLRHEIENEIKKKGLEGFFHLLGWRRDISNLINASDVLVLTSFWEGLPRVIPQAMAASVPVVVTRVNGSPEAVKDGENGFLLNPGDIDGIAEKTVFLLENPEEAKEMGKKGSFMVEEFDIHKMVADQERLYAELLNFSG